jgi:predicted lipid-binding transport protein (Tim44 family)
MSDVAKSQTPPPSTLTEPALTRVPREYHHGRSPASWVGSMTALAGALVGTIGFLAGAVGVIIAGFVIIGAALIATVLLRSMGYGQPSDTQGDT